MSSRRGEVLLKRALVAGIVVALAAVACAKSPEEESLPEPRLVADGRFVMGTTLELSIVGTDYMRLKGVMDECYALVDELDATFDRFWSGSELSRVLARSGGGPIEADARLVSLVDRALAYSAMTDGIFDITVGPLVQLWTTAAQRDRIPPQAEIDEALSKVGGRHVTILSPTSLELAQGVEIDLGAIAKGEALDRVAAHLRRLGYGDALLSFGQSSTWAMGKPLDAPAWKLGVRSLDRGIAMILHLSDRALSVSSSVGQESLIQGKRFGQQVDPRTGWPVSRQRQVLVVSDNAALADALSTALTVMKLDRGIAVAEHTKNVEAMIIDLDEGTRKTSGWDAAVAEPGV